ncbi:hypothetical protein [Neobacillus cucumis]|uniref:hypothetical protein n=1 Tax=Neobacillus cucumis TaxID=1740721 RepID=UPI002852FF37|nr:hypothetical protein [Neobacillus cucumis]MDR4947700.1 hypothetical protein [Neobacillus cucumis]MED4225736.1 hypothetical protein [Neobacillus cucumis]
MDTHVRSELSLLSELLLSILLTATIALYCYKAIAPFPWLTFIGFPLGIALMVGCWENKKHSWSLFITGVLFSGLVWLIYYNWSSLL